MATLLNAIWIPLNVRVVAIWLQAKLTLLKPFVYETSKISDIVIDITHWTLIWLPKTAVNPPETEYLPVVC